MPGFITHYICGQAVLGLIMPEASRLITPFKSVYNIGTQGPDIFFYYLPGLIKKRLRDMGTQMHKQNTGQFFQAMLNRIAASKDSERDTLFAYLAGYLTHYALDVYAHPYVYGKTGMFEKGSRARALTFSVRHRKFETAIDVLMLKLVSSEKPSDYKLWQLIRADKRQTTTVSHAVSAAVQKAYGRDINSKDVYKAMAYMVNLTRILQSQKGRRKKCLELLEDLIIGEHLVTSLIHMQSVNDGVDYMNIQKTPWHMPWDKETEKTDSFVELYNGAVANAVDMINLLYRYTRGGLPKATLLKTIGNRSLSTGAECIKAL